MTFDILKARELCKKATEEIVNSPSFIAACNKVEEDFTKLGIKNNCDQDFIKYLGSDEFLDNLHKEYIEKNELVAC